MRLAAALALLAGAAGANPIDAFGLGSRAAAMGGAATAEADDASACYYNPAGLAAARELRIDLGYRHALPLLRLNGRAAEIDDARGFVAGIVAPGELFGVHYAFGAALALPDRALARVRSAAFDAPRFVYYDNRPQRMFLNTSLAVRLPGRLHFGAGVTFLSRSQGQVDLKGNVAISRPDDSALVSRVDVGLFSVRYPHVGLSWEANDRLRLGVSFRGEFVLRFDQTFRIDGSLGDPGQRPLVEAGFFETRTLVTDVFQPWQLTAGASLKAAPGLTAALDLTFARWSRFPPRPPLSVALDVGPVFNPLVNLPPAREYPEPGFHDLLIPRLGVEWRAREGRGWALDVRGGYSYEASPAPEQTGESNLADAAKHSFSLGAGLELNALQPVVAGGLSIDAHLAATWLPTRVNRKADPLDRVGDFTSGGAVWQAGLTLRSRL